MSTEPVLVSQVAIPVRIPVITPVILFPKPGSTAKPSGISFPEVSIPNWAQQQLGQTKAIFRNQTQMDSYLEEKVSKYPLATTAGVKAAAENVLLNILSHEPGIKAKPELVKQIRGLLTQYISDKFGPNPLKNSRVTVPLMNAVADEKELVGGQYAQLLNAAKATQTPNEMAALKLAIAFYDSPNLIDPVGQKKAKDQLQALAADSNLSKVPSVTVSFEPPPKGARLASYFINADTGALQTKKPSGRYLPIQVSIQNGNESGSNNNPSYHVHLHKNTIQVALGTPGGGGGKKPDWNLIILALGTGMAGAIYLDQRQQSANQHAENQASQVKQTEQSNRTFENQRLDGEAHQFRVNLKPTLVPSFAAGSLNASTVIQKWEAAFAQLNQQLSVQLTNATTVLTSDRVPSRSSYMNELIAEQRKYIEKLKIALSTLSNPSPQQINAKLLEVGEFSFHRSSDRDTYGPRGMVRRTVGQNMQAEINENIAQFRAALVQKVGLEAAKADLSTPSAQTAVPTSGTKPTGALPTSVGRGRSLVAAALAKDKAPLTLALLEPSTFAKLYSWFRQPNGLQADNTVIDLIARSGPRPLSKLDKASQQKILNSLYREQTQLLNKIQKTMNPADAKAARLVADVLGVHLLLCAAQLGITELSSDESKVNVSQMAGQIKLNR